MTHKEKIINFVKNRDWVSGYAIEKYAIEAGGKPATFGRRAREIAEAGIFERRMNGKNVEYKYVGISLDNSYGTSIKDLEKETQAILDIELPKIYY